MTENSMLVDDLRRELECLAAENISLRIAEARAVSLHVAAVAASDENRRKIAVVRKRLIEAIEGREIGDLQEVAYFPCYNSPRASIVAESAA